MAAPCPRRPACGRIGAEVFGVPGRDRSRWLSAERRHHPAARRWSGVLGTTRVSRRLAISAGRHAQRRNAARSDVPRAARRNRPEPRARRSARRHAGLAALQAPAPLRAAQRKAAVHRPKAGLVPAALPRRRIARAPGPARKTRIRPVPLGRILVPRRARRVVQALGVRTRAALSRADGAEPVPHAAAAATGRGGFAGGADGLSATPGLGLSYRTASCLLAFFEGPRVAATLRVIVNACNLLTVAVTILSLSLIEGDPGWHWVILLLAPLRFLLVAI